MFIIVLLSPLLLHCKVSFIFTWFSLLQLIAACQAACLYAIYLSLMMSSHVIFDLPIGTLLPTSECLTCFIQSLSSFLLWPNQCSLLYQFCEALNHMSASQLLTC